MAKKRKVYVNKELNNIKGLTFDSNGIPELTKNNIMLVDNYVRNDSSYSTDSGDDFALKYFKSHLEEPLELSTVITRIILIDTIDSTNLKVHLGKDYYKLMAKRIMDEDIEAIIKEGKPLGEKFKNIAKWPAKKGSKKNDLNLFIFISKYITRVNEYCYGRSDYSIMDSVVKENLPLFAIIGVDIPDLELIRTEYDYDKYCDVIKSILKEFDGITRTMLDHFIWFSFKNEAVGDKKTIEKV